MPVHHFHEAQRKSCDKPPVTLAEFADTAADYLRKQGELRPIAIDLGAAQLIVGSGAGPVSFVALTAAWNECRDARGLMRERVLARRFWSSIQADAEHGEKPYLRSILPKVRDLGWYSSYRRHVELELGIGAIQEPNTHIPSVQLADALSVHLAIPLPTYLLDVTEAFIEESGLSFASLLERALARLEAATDAPYTQLSPGVFESPFQDGFDASRMAIPKVFAALPVQGFPVAIAPTHSSVFVAGDADPDGLQSIAQRALDSIDEAPTHSPLAFRLVQGKWSIWQPAAGHPATSILRRVRVTGSFGQHERQQTLLKGILAAGDLQLVVAPFYLVQTEAGEVESLTEWSQGDEALLPDTDLIELKADSQTTVVPFSAFLASVGSELPTTGDVPRRYIAKAFPGERALAELRKHQVNL